MSLNESNDDINISDVFMNIAITILIITVIVELCNICYIII